MEAIIFSKGEISAMAYDMEENDYRISLLLSTDNGEKVTLFASVGSLYKMAQGIENALDNLDIPPCDTCGDYDKVTLDAMGNATCEPCQDEAHARDYATLMTYGDMFVKA